jgi:hydrogenase/urease accessory protein HupE
MTLASKTTRRSALAAAVAVSLAASFTAAHEVGLSRGTYGVSGEVVTAELVLSRKEAASVAPELDPDRDGKITEAELTAARPSFQKTIVDRIRVSSAEAPCPGALAEARLSEEDGLDLRATYSCPAPVTRAKIELALIEDLAHGHRHIARSAAGTQVTETVLSRSQRTFEVTGSGGAAAPPAKRSHLAMLELGLEHILTGYDHLVFLLGLVLVGGRWRSLLWVVTAFTLAHSITLGLAVLGVWAPRPSVVEPLIALSIAYVGVENFFVKDAEKRWRITFPFGLVHGFGFAGALQEVTLPKADVPAALFLFNAGVELGQVAVLAVVLPLLAALRKRAWFDRYGVKGGSALIIVAGLAWFFLRVFGGK